MKMRTKEVKREKEGYKKVRMKWMKSENERD